MTINTTFNPNISFYSELKLFENPANTVQQPPDLISNLPPDLQKSILKYSDIPGVKDSMKVTNKWSILTDDAFIWDSIARDLHMQQPPLINKNIVKENVLNIKYKTRNCLMVLNIKDIFKAELHRLLQSEEINDINKLQDICKAQDIFSVWGKLQKQGGNSFDLGADQFVSTAQFIETAALFGGWCNINQAALDNIQELDLRMLGLTSLPPEIGLLTNLTDLFLNINQLNSLPPEIGLLTKLTNLTFFKNKLKSLPPEIGLLTNLTHLFLTDNQLESLPPEIGLLTNLKHLTLLFNQLKSLPSEIGLLTNLTYFNLGQNQLKSLPTEIGLLSNLTEFDVHSNQLETLPWEICLTDLKSLVITDNLLTTLPSEIGLLKQLMKIEVNGNPLTSLPPEIAKLPRNLQLDIIAQFLRAKSRESWKGVKDLYNNVSEIFETRL